LTLLSSYENCAKMAKAKVETFHIIATSTEMQVFGTDYTGIDYWLQTVDV
jgi:hypothetical protein